MICPNCYNVIFGHDVYCPNCGYQLHGKTNSNDNLGYRLDAKLPVKPELQSRMGARYIARYKYAMGFPFNEKNIVHASKRNPDLQYDHLPDPLKNVYQSENDTTIPQKNEYILSFDDSGLLIMGVVEFVRQAIYKENGQYDFNDYNFHFTHHNRFIPKSKIKKADLQGDPSNQKLVMNVNDQQKMKFKVPKVWQAKHFQMKNFQRLDKLVNKLN